MEALLHQANPGLLEPKTPGDSSEEEIDQEDPYGFGLGNGSRPPSHAPEAEPRRENEHEPQQKDGPEARHGRGNPGDLLQRPDDMFNEKTFREMFDYFRRENSRAQFDMGVRPEEEMAESEIPYDPEHEHDLAEMLANRVENEDEPFFSPIGPLSIMNNLTTKGMKKVIHPSERIIIVGGCRIIRRQRLRRINRANKYVEERKKELELKAKAIREENLKRLEEEENEGSIQALKLQGGGGGETNKIHKTDKRSRKDLPFTDHAVGQLPILEDRYQETPTSPGTSPKVHLSRPKKEKTVSSSEKPEPGQSNPKKDKTFAPSHQPGKKEVGSSEAQTTTQKKRPVVEFYDYDLLPSKKKEIIYPPIRTDAFETADKAMQTDPYKGPYVKRSKKIIRFPDYMIKFGKPLDIQLIPRAPSLGEKKSLVESTLEAKGSLTDVSIADSGMPELLEPEPEVKLSLLSRACIKLGLKSAKGPRVDTASEDTTSYSQTEFYPDELDDEYLWYTSSENSYDKIEEDYQAKKAEKTTTDMGVEDECYDLMRTLAPYFWLLKFTGRMPVQSYIEERMIKFRFNLRSFNCVLFALTSIFLGVNMVILTLSGMGQARWQGMKTDQFSRDIERLAINKWIYFTVLTWLLLVYSSVCSMAIIFKEGDFVADFFTRINMAISTIHYDSREDLPIRVWSRILFFVYYTGGLLYLFIFHNDDIPAVRGGSALIANMILRPFRNDWLISKEYHFLEIYGLFIHLFAAASAGFLIGTPVIYAKIIENLSRIWNLRTAYVLKQLGYPDEDDRIIVHSTIVPTKKLFEEFKMFTSFVRQIGYTFSATISFYSTVKFLEFMVLGYRAISILIFPSPVGPESGQIVVEHPLLPPGLPPITFVDPVYSSIVAAVYIFLQGFLEWLINSRLLYNCGQAVMYGCEFARRYGMVCAKSSTERRFVQSIQSSYGPTSHYYIKAFWTMNLSFVWDFFFWTATFLSLLTAFSPFQLETQLTTVCDVNGTCIVTTGSRLSYVLAPSIVGLTNNRTITEGTLPPTTTVTSTIGLTVRGSVSTTQITTTTVFGVTNVTVIVSTPTANITLTTLELSTTMTITPTITPTTTTTTPTTRTTTPTTTTTTPTTTTTTPTTTTTTPTTRTTTPTTRTTTPTTRTTTPTTRTTTPTTTTTSTTTTTTTPRTTVRPTLGPRPTFFYDCTGSWGAEVVTVRLPTGCDSSGVELVATNRYPSLIDATINGECPLNAQHNFVYSDSNINSVHDCDPSFAPLPALNISLEARDSCGQIGFRIRKGGVVTFPDKRVIRNPNPTLQELICCFDFEVPNSKQLQFCNVASRNVIRKCVVIPSIRLNEIETYGTDVDSKATRLFEYIMGITSALPVISKEVDTCFCGGSPPKTIVEAIDDTCFH